MENNKFISQIENKWLVDRNNLKKITDKEQLYDKRELISWWPFAMDGLATTRFQL